MQQIWEEMGLQEQYEDESESPQIIRDALKDMIEEMCPWLSEAMCPRLSEAMSKSFLPIECYIENLYCRTVHNFGFNGDPMGLPIEVSYRLFEIFIFLQDRSFTHFIAIVIHCL